jgi:hypothetical protein
MILEILKSKDELKELCLICWKILYGNAEKNSKLVYLGIITGNKLWNGVASDKHPSLI